MAIATFSNSSQEPFVADITYIAGKQIHLLPGFKVINGGKFHGKIEDMGECKVLEGIYDIFNLPNNNSFRYLAINTNADSINSQINILKTDSVNSNKANKFGSPEASGLIENSISIYPNPTCGIVNVQCNNDLPFRVEITNLLGENIYSSNIVTINIKVNLTPYGKGIYFIKISDENSVLRTDKIIYK